MRIEKISDKQIRCTLTQADLQNHHINIGELAYGSEKARSLFQEMLSQASREFNFHAENMPLMIEAVPMSGDNLVLVITKVEDPDEIDTRFSKFSPYKKTKQDTLHFDDEPTDPAYITEPDFFRVYAFLSIDEVCRASRALQSAYDADNSLYKDPQHNRYYLVLHKGDHSPQTFNIVCNILSEYAESIHCNAGTESHYKEHFTLILAKHALQALKQL